MKRGFTLIELLVVVLIIGILSAVALPQYQKAVEKTRAIEAVQMMATLTRSIDIWLMENGGFPSDDMHAQHMGLPVELCDSKFQGEKYCEMKNFDIWTNCTVRGCSIDLSPKKGNYFLMLQKDSVGGEWDKKCVVEGVEYSTNEVHVCKSLESFGYTYEGLY